MIVADDDADRKREALRMLSQNPQTSVSQEQLRQQAPRDLSQVRPQVIRAVGEQERRAEQVVSATAQLFGDMIRKSDDPALKRAVKDSSMNSMLEMV
jgi:hypothetical protein